MMTAITVGLGSVKAGYEALKALNTAMTEVKLLEVRSELYGALADANQGLLAAHEAQLESANRVHALETEILRLKDWSAEAEQYELADAGHRCLAYRPKDGEKGGEPPHWLCPTCFAKREKSFLQPETLAVGRVSTLVCNSCDTRLYLSGARQDAPRGRR